MIGNRKSAEAIPVNKSAMDRKDIVAAIDFGTTFSGCAFQSRADFGSSPLKIELVKLAGSSGLSEKTSTAILFDKQKKFVAFGHDAEELYNQKLADGNQFDWYFYRRFKMFLYNRLDLAKNNMIKSVGTGKEMSAMLVFQEAIRYLKDTGLHAIQKKYNKGINDIHWILTVPAIWDDPAKQFMREAAINVNNSSAGIATDNLSLSLEPEAAALFCRYLPHDRSTDLDGSVSIKSFRIGDRYLVLDVGGGTVDITVYEVYCDDQTKTVALRELDKANGGEWGGTSVDGEFESMLEEVLGPEVMEIVRSQYNEDFMSLMAVFEVKKRNVTPDSISRETFALPQSITDLYKQIQKTDLEEGIKSIQKYRGKISVNKDKMSIEAEMMKEFLRPIVEQICGITKEIVNQKEDLNINKILMVGGFSESKMLQQKVRETFSTQLLIVPESAGLCVLKGAVINGHNPSMITVRVCKYTYGIRAYEHFEPALDPREKREIIGDRVLCKDRFSVYGRVDQAFEKGEAVGDRVYVPRTEDATSLQIEVYTTNEKYPRFVNSETCRKLGHLEVPLGDIARGQPREFRVQFVFGDPELGVVATHIATGKKIQGEFDFL
ncbi:heat shock 70 kDa protein 12A-like isoform X3 [Dreissena polymorpha]|uniref:heat shock 70 kDa protein 12A-like isoform X2 n=1 Tax=Dreissena polymorpha TaxID=45954 RepID=UPI0022644BAC|nr:heat shock 70 kDa protein 12A-like isoform X2 [Dreissena polymorpha]XP_052277507.1 heat shock 70 kDa protein 12A-like isoform X3 [Dreissena polymorpha]